MLKQTSEKFRKFFLLEFTRELITAYSPQEILKLQRLVEKKDNEISRVFNIPVEDNIKEIVKEHKKKFVYRELEPAHLKTSSQRLREDLVTLKRTRPVLRIPELRLPPTMDYLRPSPGGISEIDLGKLNPLIKDPLVKVIECNGPEENIIVIGGMGTKPTKVVLNKEEINGVITKFSEETKIPVDEGVYKAALGSLVLSAIVSETVGSKFIIKKIPAYPGFSPQKS